MNNAGKGAVETAARWSPLCVVCRTPLGGAIGLVFRAAGIRRSTRNPNLCSRCNTHAEEGHLVEMTVLFADLTAFTELTAKLGPQRAHEVVDAFLRMATQALVAQDGYIDKYLGDAVMALFNAPIRREDHAARAVHAAIAIQAGLLPVGERFGLDLKAGVGVASGWAHVGRLGSSDKRDYTAVGEVVNLAARLKDRTRPGEILVDRTAYEWVAEEFPAVPEEALTLKGFADPVQAYRLQPASGLPQPQQTVETPRRRAISLGSAVFAILGAPCAAYAILGPWAVALGISGLFGATSALWFFDADAVRFPLLGLATLGAVANLYAVWHAKALGRQAEAKGQFVALTKRERRRSLWVVGASVLTLGLAAFEVIAHIIFHA